MRSRTLQRLKKILASSRLRAALVTVALSSALLPRIASAQTPTFYWATNVGGPGFAEGYAVAVDSSNGVYLSGWFGSPTAKFGSLSLTNLNTNNPTANIFIAKYDNAGNALWAVNIGQGGAEQFLGFGVATDASNNVFIVGESDSMTMTAGSTTLTNLGGNYGSDILVLKYDSSGNLLWATNAGGDSYDGASAVCVDREGNVCLTGYFYSHTARFGDLVLTRRGTSDDRFVAKYDGNGNALWATSFVGDNGIYVYDMAMDRVDNLWASPETG
jgi:hypothetical protein